MLLPVYLAVRIAENVVSARVNDAGLVAGVRRINVALLDYGSALTIGTPSEEAFVWCDGKIVFHDATCPCVAGPNARGQVALGGRAGLFVWQDGRLTRCSGKPIAAIAGIADDGSVVARTDYAAPSWGESVVWPSDHTADRHYRFGPRLPVGPPTDFAPEGIVEYAPDGGYIDGGGRQRASFAGASGGPNVRTPNGFWSYGARGSGVFPNGLARNGYAIATRPRATGVWHNGDILQLDFKPYKPGLDESDSLLAVNGKGDAVGRASGRIVVWEGESRIDLGEAAGGPRLDDALAISDNGNVLARSGPTLYLLRRRG